MPRKIRQIKADLRKIGAYQVSQEGSHTKWEHPFVPTILILSGHDGDDAKPYQEKDVRRWLQRVVRVNKKED